MKITQIEKLNQLISRTDMTGNQKVEWLASFIDEHVTEQLRLKVVVVELPKVNSTEFKDWLKSEGYKNKSFGIYQKENKDYCYKLLYKHYCNILEFGN